MNHLQNESSPYLRQHATNPVDWYPWGKEAFSKAAREDKPVFLSIGYSTCHWCHVMAHESFENDIIAAKLNANFIAVKVDREQRPDIDQLYMTVCQALTGSGGWPMTVLLTPEQKPFFAGTYFPPFSRPGSPGLLELLTTATEKWQQDRAALLTSADAITAALNRSYPITEADDTDLIETAVRHFRDSYDAVCGGFGKAPKFPSPHPLLFLLRYAEKHQDATARAMVEHTLTAFYRGGLFDHIGFGFCRYATDRRFLVPHFEKMLYDNALLITAYCRAFSVTGNSFYRDVAEKTAAYVLRELSAQGGGFHSAQDADSEGEEGKYYLFTPQELENLFGRRDGKAFCAAYGITAAGNFEGKSIPNRLHDDRPEAPCADLLPRVQAYRRQRFSLHTDDKILTAWNALMITAFCDLYAVTQNNAYLTAARDTDAFIRQHLTDGEALLVSFRAGQTGTGGFLEDYAFYAHALLSLYTVTLETTFLDRALALVRQTIRDFFDPAAGGFFLSGQHSEALIARPKESGDGAMPSGNTVMALNLVQLLLLCAAPDLEEVWDKQQRFLSAAAAAYPEGYTVFLCALSDFRDPPPVITAVLKTPADREILQSSRPAGALIRVRPEPTEEYPLLHDRLTYYVCYHHRCLPPTNTLNLTPQEKEKKNG